MKSLAFILIAAMIWLVGLLAFAARIDRSTPAPEPARADGIVALTGPSTARLEAAMQLLEDKKAKRLLISGVNREASREDIRAVAGASSGVYDCCVDLGFSAANTVGNAREAEAWAKSHKFKSLIVVTSDYHMPRSVLELKGALPGVKFQAYPVRTEELDSAHWWRSAGSARRMVIEYLKYIVILARESLLSLGPREQAADEAVAPVKSVAKTPLHAKAKPAR